MVEADEVEAKGDRKEATEGQSKSGVDGGGLGRASIRPSDE